RDFYLTYSNHPFANLARESEYNLLEIVVGAGYTDQLERLRILDRKKLADPALPDKERFDLMVHTVERNANSHLDQGNETVMAWLESGSRELLQAFPNNPDSWQFLVTVADQAQDPQKGRKLAEEIISSKASDDLKTSARRILKRLDHIGKPVALQGTAFDGRKINLKEMTGKVV